MLSAMFVQRLSRRRFLKGAGAGAGALLLGGALQACRDSSASGAGSAAPPDAAAVGEAVGEAVGYERLVLYAGPRGQIERDWTDRYAIELVRPDGTVVLHGDRADRSRINSAHDAVEAPDGTFWVTDTGHARLIHFSHRLTVLGTIDTIAGRRLSRPQGITMAGDSVVVTDTGIGLIAVTDGSGDGVWIGSPLEDQPAIAAGSHRWSATAAGVLDNPKAVEGALDGTIVVFDNAARRLTAFGADGTVRSSIDLSGTPSSFAMDPAGAMYVADPVRHLVYRVGTDGTETPVTVFDRDRNVAISERDAETWQPYRLTWRRGTVDSPSGLIVSVLPR